MPQNVKITKWKNTFGRVLLFCIFCALILIIVSPLTKGLAKPWSEIVLALTASLAVYGLTILFVRFEKLQLREVGVVPSKGTILHVVKGFIIGLILAGVHAGLMMAYGHLDFVWNQTNTISGTLLMFVLYTLIAIREELAFRGYALRSLDYVIGSWKAQLIIALIFSLEHVAGGYTWQQAFLGAGTGAILFGIAALKTKGIALPIGIHIAWNFGQWCVGLKNEPGIWQASIEKGYESKYEQASLVFYLVLMLITITIFYIYRPPAEIISDSDKNS